MMTDEIVFKSILLDTFQLKKMFIFVIFLTPSILFSITRDYFHIFMIYLSLFGKFTSDFRFHEQISFK